MKKKMKQRGEISFATCIHTSQKESVIKSHMTQKHLSKITKMVQETEENDPKGLIDVDILTMAHWDKLSTTDEPTIDPVAEKELTNEIAFIEDSPGLEGNLNNLVRLVNLVF